jgi:uncharacterized repeat protein (TIGR03803 family)
MKVLELVALMASAFCTPLPCGAKQPAALTTLYSFTGESGDGASPYAGVVAASNGILYGTTGFGGMFGAGTVYKLTPPVQGGGWTETVLYSFSGGSDGGYPQGGVVIGPSGSLYGATLFGGVSGMGAVFSLTPPAVEGGDWTESPIFSFSGSDGAYPYAGPIGASGGVLYGTTELGGTLGYGAVYQLTPPAAGKEWTETVLYNFTGETDGAFPYAGVAIDTKGDLYGSATYGGTSQMGVVFELIPQGGGGDWSETVLHAFNGSDGGFPNSGVAIGTSGSLYGTTPGGVGAGDGTAYELTPPVTGQTWKETILQKFTDGNKGGSPHAAPALGPSGALLGTTLAGGSGVAWNGYGLVFELNPPAGGGAWTEDVLYTFEGGDDGGDPDGSLVPGADGVF